MRIIQPIPVSIVVTYEHWSGEAAGLDPEAWRRPQPKIGRVDANSRRAWEGDELAEKAVAIRGACESSVQAVGGLKDQPTA